MQRRSGLRCKLARRMKSRRLTWKNCTIATSMYMDRATKAIKPTLGRDDRKEAPMDLKQFQVWYVTGSQHLYGPKTLEQVAEHSREIAGALGSSKDIPVQVVFKPVLTTPEQIRDLCLDANTAKNCVGLIIW